MRLGQITHSDIFMCSSLRGAFFFLLLGNLIFNFIMVYADAATGCFMSLYCTCIYREWHRYILLKEFERNDLDRSAENEHLPYNFEGGMQP